MLAWIRTVVAGVLFARAILWAWEAIRPPRPYGVTPWGEATGLRIRPLGRSETAAARRLEGVLARGLLTGASSL